MAAVLPNFADLCVGGSMRRAASLPMSMSNLGQCGPVRTPRLHVYEILRR